MTRWVTPSVSEIPRARWLRRIVLMTVALSAIVLLLRLIAGVIADRRTAAQRSRLHDLGFATRVEDLALPAIPDAQNAAPLWMQAFAAVSANVFSPRQSSYDERTLGIYPPYTAKWHELADASEVANASAFALADSARARLDCNWGTHYTSGVFMPGSTKLNTSRELANVLCDSFERNLLLGDEATAMTRLLSSFALAAALRREPDVVCQLTAMSIDEMSCEALRANIGLLRIDTADPVPSRRHKFSTSSARFCPTTTANAFSSPRCTAT